MGVGSHHLVAWITGPNWQTSADLRLGDCRSDTVASSTGAPQGTVFSPVLFTLYTSDFQYKSEFMYVQSLRTTQPWAVSGIRSGQEDECTCSDSPRLLNNTKTHGEMVVDLGDPGLPEPQHHQDQGVMVVDNLTQHWSSGHPGKLADKLDLRICAGKDWR
ncbi:hypothetical protein L3Q82_000557 [Scortum barcoo]|uniref:Uncharacterized protein n=1 Tax=Scortum barcoo TaxID=214431 RepID=A0ACB8WEQ0_9TELE|nr:hypothetical protein L3Q82_000557 [Scortum barcoo]